MKKHISIILSFLIMASLLTYPGLFIHTAEAGVPVIETNPSVLSFLGATTAATGGNLAKRIMEFVFKLSTENLKRNLLDTLVSQMVTSVAGGQPQYVTNWESFSQNSYQAGRANALKELQSQGVFNSLPGQQVYSQITGQPAPAYSPTIEERYQAQNKSFDWNAYSNSWNPANNYYGLSMQTEYILDAKGKSAKEAALNEAVSGEGFLSTKDSSGNITTPGKTIGDTLSRAVTSDIDYLVNVQDLAGFANAISSSIFNQLVGSGGFGISGVANNILSGGGVGSFSLSNNGTSTLGNLGDLALDIVNNNRSSLSGFTFNSDSDRQLSNGYNTTVPRDINDPILQNQVNQEIDRLTNSGLNISLKDLNIDTAGLTLGSVQQNKINSYIDVQKTVWFLDDLKKSLALKPLETREEIVRNWLPYGPASCVSANSNSIRNYLLPNLGGNETERLNKIAQIDSTLNKVKTLLKEIGTDISNSSSSSDTPENITIAALQRELLRNLFQADLTIGNPLSGNFDSIGQLPITLKPTGLNSKVSGIVLKYYVCNDNRNELTYSDLSIKAYPYESLQFFRNNIQFEYSRSTSGNGNYLGLTMALDTSIAGIESDFRDDTKNEFFYVNYNQIDGYLSALESKLATEVSLRDPTKTLDNTALNRRLSYRSDKESVISELDRALRYLTDVEPASPLISTLRSNLDQEILNLKKVTVNEAEVKSAREQSVALENLFLAGLGQKGAGEDFDVTNVLPINVNEHPAGADGGDYVIPIDKGNIKTSLTPYSGNQNFLGFSVNTIFYRHPANQVNYLTTLSSKISQLKLDGFLK